MERREAPLTLVYTGIVDNAKSCALLARLIDLVHSKVCIAKICWTKSNFPSKCDFKYDEDKIKYSLAPCEGIFKFQQTLLV